MYLIAQSFGLDYKPRSILATHAFDLARNEKIFEIYTDLTSWSILKEHNVGIIMTNLACKTFDDEINTPARLRFCVDFVFVTQRDEEKTKRDINARRFTR